VSARLVADELYFNLATLTASLVVIVVVVVGRAGAGPFDAARFCSGAIAGGVRLFEFGWRRLVVLVGDVGHVCPVCDIGITKRLKKAKMVEMLF